MANNRKRSDDLIVLGGFLSQIIELQYFLAFIQVVSAVSFLVNVYRSGEKKRDF